MTESLQGADQEPAAKTNNPRPALQPDELTVGELVSRMKPVQLWATVVGD